MNKKFKYIVLAIDIILLNFGTNSYNVSSIHTSGFSPRNLRIKRQAGYVYDRPTVSFDLPTATSIATTQAPTVDIDRMQMYYAYPVPTSGAADTTNVIQQNTIATGSASATVSSGASGYNYGLQNTQVTEASAAVSSGAGSGYNYGVQNTEVTGASATISSGAGGYNYGVQNTPVIGSQTNTLTGSQKTGATGYQGTAVTKTQTVVSSGSTGYNSDRPSPVFNTGVTTGSVSTSAPRYLPPQAASENTAGVSATANNQAQTGTQISDSYIPPSVQVSSQENIQSVVTQTRTNAQTSSANVLNTGYLLPSTASQQSSITLTNPTISTSTGQTQRKTVALLPTRQYLPPIESSAESKSRQSIGPLTAPASTYLPPVF